MDKSWIDLPNRMSMEYIAGIDQFLTFAYSTKHESLVICCPCRSCANRYNLPRVLVKEHLITKGFLKNYKNWVYHGESYVSSQGNIENEFMVESENIDDMVGMLHEAMGIPHVGASAGNDEQNANSLGTGPNEETAKYFKLLESAQSQLYPGCKAFTSLSFTVRLLHTKVIHHWTDDSFNALLEMLNEAFPEGVKLAKSYYEAQKITEDLGFTYNTWDVCRSSCMLFRGEDAKLDACALCGKSRWKQMNGNSNDCKRIAVKQMRYFPLKPRLQRLFKSSKKAKLMRWHAEERLDDGVYRHPGDSPAWKEFDRKNTCFASDCRNVRLGLASDGFNPFRTMNIVHSTWPVILIPYNLPPWMCMKQPNLILSILIDGPKGPGDKIDVYLQPLIEELNELWNEGVPTFDASTNQMFQMHACLLWTINDFPAYANLSGWSTKGEYACPCCNKETQSKWLKHGKKQCYMGHRRFLPGGHKFRKDKVSFDGQREYRQKPKVLSGSDLLRQLESEGILTQYKRDDLEERLKRSKEREKAGSRDHNWKKKSIFFELPYWEHNLIRHNLDVMHTEKNVCDNVLWTLLGVMGKSKDNANARLDLQEMNIRKPLHLQLRGSSKAYVPPAQFTMSKDEKDLFFKVLKEVKSPLQQPHSDPTTTHHPSNTSSSTPSQSMGIAELNDSDPTSSKSSRSKRGRGKAKGIKEWGSGVKIAVQFDELFDPLKPNGPRLKTQLGVMVRNCYRVPLTFLDWDSVTEDIKEDIWKEVKDNLEDCPDGFKIVCMKICHKIWKDNKGKIKREYYKPYMPPVVPQEHADPDIATKVPPYVDPDQWRQLVEYWSLKKIEKQAQRNAKNRTFLGPLPKTGRTHFSQIRYDMAAKGERLDKMSIFKKTRKGDDPDVERIVAEFDRQIELLPEDERTIETQDRIYHDIMGEDKHGYCRTYGGGVPRSSVYKKNSRPSQEINPSLMASIEERITKSVMEEVVSSLTQKFTTEFDQLRAHVLGYMESRASEDGRQVLDASSGHRVVKESVGGTSASERSHSTPPLSPRPDDEQARIHVYLQNFDIPKEDVGEGLLITRDTTSEIDHEPLCKGYCKVYILKAIKPNACLEKPRRGAITIGEAVGRYVAWRSSDVIEEEMDG